MTNWIVTTVGVHGGIYDMMVFDTPEGALECIEDIKKVAGGPLESVKSDYIDPGVFGAWFEQAGDCYITIHERIVKSRKETV